MGQCNFGALDNIATPFTNMTTYTLTANLVVVGIVVALLGVWGALIGQHHV